MKKLKHLYKKLLSENINITSPNGKKITSAIKKRNPISFYYNGPKGEVKPGRRIRVEPVALGLSKGGNLVIRGWAQPPSESKKGFTKHGWRLFRLDRISNLIVDENDQFNVKRPNYKEGDDGSMVSTYVTTSWTSEPTDIKPQIEKPQPTREPEVTQPEKPTPQPPEIEKPVEPEEPETTTTLPQPKPDEKPSILPQSDTKTDTNKVFSNIDTEVKDIDGKKTIDPNYLKTSLRDLYLQKLNDWKTAQQKLNLNTTPGEGTRRKFEKDSEVELFNYLKNKNISLETKNELQESIEKIKHLMFF